MRPVRLEAEGFTCYRERQEPLEFNGLSLFAIAGPTGAGKSSILDTILFALYGEVPRIGKQGLGEFIAHGRDAMSVTLDFAVRGSVYRVTRRVKRGKKGTLTSAALLEEVAPTPRPLSENVKPVNDAVERLLGLDFGAFTQTVILPQGEFAKFLKAEPKAQRGILQHLLRHEIFERMRAEAERRRSESEQGSRMVERQLADFAHASDGALVVAQEELTRQRAELVGLAERKDAQAAALDVHRVLRQLTVEAQQLRDGVRLLEAQAPDIESKRMQLAAARRAAEIVPRLESRDAAANRLAEAERARVTAEAAASAAQGQLASLEARLASASTTAAQLPDLARRIRALDEIKGELSRRDALAAELAQLTRTRPEIEARARRAEAAAATARSAQLEAESALAAAQAALASCGFDAAEEHRLQEVWTTVARLRALDDEVSRLGAAQQALESSVVDAEKALGRQEKALAAATRAAEKTASAEREAAAARERGRTTHQAAAVRAHLHAGEACPVCLQTVVLMPPQERVPELDGLDAAYVQAQAALATARQAQLQAGEARAKAAAQFEAARQARDLSLASLQRQGSSRESLCAAIAAALGEPANLAGGADVAVRAETRRTALRAARQAHDRASEQCRVAEASRAAAEVALVKADADARAATEAQVRLGVDETARRAEYQALVERIAAVSAEADPSAERAALARQAEALETALRQAQAALASGRAEVASAGARLEAAVAAAGQAAAAAAGAEEAVRTALTAARFASIADVTGAVRSPAVQTALDDAIRRHESEHAAAMKRLLVVEPQVAGREVSAGALAASEADAQTTFQAWRATDLDVASRESGVVRLEADVARRRELEAELGAARATLVLHAGMAADLKGDAFQEYLLEEAFHALVSGASVRMRRMSNRYTLEWEEGSFYVVDHDNAGERRRAETLSGGETFMASLCLALQLSDEVLKTSGALQMDSLFIDEGFGTLDTDSLAEVTDAMEALGQDGARLIGVISHRPELTERLPGCIRVTKGAGESRWALERVG